MSDLGRRAFGAILSGGVIAWANKKQGRSGTGGGNTTNPDGPEIQLDGAEFAVDTDTVTVDVDAANYGGQEGDATVLFRDQVEELDSRSVTLEAGAVEALQFTNDYQNITADDVTLDVVNDQYPLAVDLTVPRQHIQFTGGTIEDSNGNEITEIEEGQTFYVVGTAENVGDRDGEKTYVLYGNDTEIDSQLVTLATGGSTSLEFSHSYDNLDLGPDETAKEVDLSVNEQGVGEISIFPPAIPDGEDFEHNNLAGTYGGDLTPFSIQTGVVDGGSYALEASGAGGSFNGITRKTTDPFDRSGVRIDYRTFHDENNTKARGGIALFTSVTGFSSADGYAIYVDTNAGSGSEIRIRRVDNGSQTTLTTFGSVSDNTWVDGAIEFQNGDITVTVDGSSATVTDTNYTSLLLAFHTFNGTQYWDDIQFSTI